MNNLCVTQLSQLEAELSGVALQIDAPQTRNALTLPTVEELADVLAEHPDDLVLLSSSTPGIFSSGADLRTDDASRARLSDLLYECYELMVTRPGVVVAVVDGPAVGGGAQLTTAADLRVASPRARWRWVGPGHGLAVGAWVLPDLLGRSRALELAMTGRWLEAEHALHAGLVSELVEDPWRAAFELARTLTGCDSAALARIKDVGTRGPLVERLRMERARNAESWGGRAPAPPGTT